MGGWKRRADYHWVRREQRQKVVGCKKAQKPGLLKNDFNQCPERLKRNLLIGKDGGTERSTGDLEESFQKVIEAK